MPNNRLKQYEPFDLDLIPATNNPRPVPREQGQAQPVLAQLIAEARAHLPSKPYRQHPGTEPDSTQDSRPLFRFD